jgi:N-acetylmuramoyl-L-alanine amidase
MKNSLLLLLLLMAIIQSVNAFGFVVLLDPGHGGSELGAMGKVWKKKGKTKKLVNVYEKDLALALAKKIKKILDKKYSVYLTRSFDRTVALNDRAQLAEKIKADLFVSIHFNSSNENQSNGFETYYLDNHQDVAIKKVEDVENKYLDGAEKIVNQILIDLVIQKTVPSSKKLARKIHSKVNKYIGKRYKMKDRGVKPGLFYVLALSKRPGVLIEAGFVSNPQELKIVRTHRFLNYYARAIADGIHDYLTSLPPKDLSLF